MRIFRFTPAAALLLAVLFLSPPAQARGGPPRFRDHVREEVLPNGLRVLLLEDHKAPVVSFQVWYRVGSRDEIPGKTGLAHLLEHMMFKGTPRFGPKTFSQIIGRNGGDDNAFTSEDQTVYFENIASDRVEVAVELEADRMAHLLLESEGFRSERDVVIEERRMRTEDDPAGELAEQLDAAAYVAHPYHNPVIGWMEDIRGLTREDALDFYQRYYRPSNAIVIAVGDFSSPALLALIRKHFGTLPNLPPPVKRAFTEPPQKGERRVILRRPAELSAIYAAYHAPRMDDPDFGPLEILDVVLAEGRSARLLQSLVYKQGLATSVYADYNGVTMSPRTFLFYAQVFPGKKVEDVQTALDREIARLRDELIPEAEVEKAKTQIKSAWYRAQDSMFYRGMLLGNYAMASDWRRIDDYLAAVLKVRPADVRRAARRTLTEENRTTAILIPTERVLRGGAPHPQGGIR